MYIMTANGWRPLWEAPQPSLVDVRENIAGLQVPASFATEQHLFLLAHREVMDKRRAEYLAKPTGILLNQVTVLDRKKLKGRTKNAH